jgi:NADPH2 dehydrogenase
VSDARYVRVAALKTADLFKRHLESSEIDLGFDPALLPPAESPFGQPFVDGPVRVGNRFCVLPMEGWDGTTEGEPSDLTRRRWQRFGASGAKLIWGGEAVAVRHDGRANPNQLLMSARNEPALASAICISVSSSRTRGVSRARTSGTVRSRSPRTSTPSSTNGSPAASR